MRVWIDKGFLIQTATVERDGVLYDLPIVFQVFEEDGTPAKGSYRGEGTLRGQTLILGDARRPEALLSEVLVAAKATKESLDFLDGFERGLADRRRIPGTRTSRRSVEWWHGYREAWLEKERLAAGKPGHYRA